MKLLLDPRTDASLIRHALAGRARSLEALVLRYQRKAYAVARAISLDPDAADDIVQEAFLLALQNLRSLRVHASFGPWFMQIVRNVARKRLRKEPVEFSPDVEPSSVTELDTAEVAETRDRIWSEVRRLPVVLREAVFLYYHEGRSVREVARALEISSAAAKKRLQAGREQLSERLWRALESTLRDLLPSARGWKAQGRRIALVTIASLPVGRTLEASVGSSGGLGLAGGSSVSVALSSLGVFVLANKAIFGSILIIAVLSGGVFLWPNKDSDPAAIDDVATGTDGTADSRSASEAALMSRLARSEAERQRLRLENRRLNTSLERAAQTDREAAPAAEPKAVTSASGIDWSNLSQLIAANVEILGKFRTNSGQAEFTAAEQAQLMQIMTAFMTVNGAARERSDHPFFDSVIFDELMLALFNDSLNLTAEQAEELSRVNRATIETALGESDLAELPPLDRFRLRREVGAEVRDALGEMLSDEQLAGWEAMRVFTDSIFEGPVHTREYGLGINRLPQEITKQWQKTFRLEVHQLERARELAEEYVENARETVERYGSDEESIRALSPDDSHQLETDLAEWQRRYEQGVLSLLNAEQVKAYSQSDPTIIRFNHGTGGSSSHKSGLF